MAFIIQRIATMNSSKENSDLADLVQKIKEDVEPKGQSELSAEKKPQSNKLTFLPV